MTAIVRCAGAVLLLVLSASLVPAATPKEIDTAIAKGADFLRNMYRGGVPAGGGGEGIETGFPLGRHALSGLAIIEAGTPIDDPALKHLIAHVRDRSYAAGKTYDVAVSLFFLDRLGDPADAPLIQMLAARLLVGQTANGGWGYDCVTVSQADEQRLRASLRVQQLVAGKEKEKATAPPVPRMHPEAERYMRAILAGPRPAGTDDNSNTQFGILGVWLARKHGVRTEAALELIEKRFVATQGQSGGWTYSGAGFSPNASPSMTCAGLLGLATGVGLREERRARAAAPPPAATKSTDPKDPKSNDPFFNPPPVKGAEKKGEAKAKGPTDAAISRAFNHLGQVLEQGRKGGKLGVLTPPISSGHGNNDLYFLWSLERVGVIYGVEKIGGLDWYDLGADAIIATQNPNGSWAKGFSAEIDTSFALLFLLKANLARDLSSKLQGGGAEMRTGGGSITNPVGGEAGAGGKGTAPMPGVAKTELPPEIANPLPVPVDDATAKMAAELVKAPPLDWAKTLEKFRDSKGGDYTKALTAAVYRLDGERKKQAREALAERLTRMNAATLRGMLTGEDTELRRGAVLACAMRDEKIFVPDLIERLLDADDSVVRAARAGLKSLAGGQSDFGPEPGSSDNQKKAAVEAWKAWWAKQKK